MSTRFAALALCLLLAAPAGAQAQAQAREVNITQGSEPGWLPDETLEAEALAVFRQFHAVLDAGDFAAAHAMLGETLRANYPLERFEQERGPDVAVRGAMVSREPRKITWTKDAPGTPEPGTYVAIDQRIVYAEAERACGYTVLHKAPGAAGFRVVRFEESLLDNAAYADITARYGPLQAQLTWRLLARTCPNFEAEPLPDSVADGVEYANPSEALAAVGTRPGIAARDEGGWTVLTDEAAKTVWTFPPEGSPFYPAVVKRWDETAADGTARPMMAMRCEAKKRMCDVLFDEMALRSGFTQVTLQE
jgi:hypothetical protein